MGLADLTEFNSRYHTAATALTQCYDAESRRKLVMHLGMFDDLWSAASMVPSAREDGLDVFLIGNRNCPPFVRGIMITVTLMPVTDGMPAHAPASNKDVIVNNTPC